MLVYDWAYDRDDKFTESKRDAELAELYALRWNGIITPEVYIDRVMALYGVEREPPEKSNEDKEAQMRRDRKGAWRLYFDLQGPQTGRTQREILSADA
jgi:hypothetical protein